MLDPQNTEQRDLRGGNAPWRARPNSLHRSNVTESFRCEVLIVGGGITGSLAAEHMASLGHEVCVVDRERPSYGSTAASTSMLQWEIDRSLNDLIELYGFARASNVYRRSREAVAALVELTQSRGFNCGLRRRHSLYIAAAEIGEKELRAEHSLRQRANLPGVVLDHRALLDKFGFDREVAIYSPGSADANPLQLSQALLESAISSGAKLFDAEALNYDEAGASVGVHLDGGFLIEAKHVILATGYVMPDFVKSDLHKVVSSWAIATPPQQSGVLWHDGALIWEASKQYHYARTTIDNRIIIGGEDDDQVVEPDERNSLTTHKAEVLSQKLQRLVPNANASPEFAWSGAFGTTTDGLPLIGLVPQRNRIHAAYGYGGNGITFSYLASRIIAASIAGHKRKWFEDFSINRDSPKTSWI